jgi:hypothetical protein
MAGPTRRHFVTASGLATGALPFSATAQSELGDVASDLERYVGYGDKPSGSPGDTATGVWLEQELRAAQFAVERSGFTAPFFEVSRAELVAGAVTATVIPQAIVTPTGAEGVSGRLVVLRPGEAVSPMAGAIALIDLPHQRWSSALSKPVRDGVAAAVAAGFVAVILITNGPTRKALALNADGREPMFPCPVAVLAPEAAAPFLTAASAGAPATVYLTGAGGRRPAFNLIGKMDRGRDRWIVVSTPRSGWFACAGERGGGIATWLALARWAPQALERFNLAFVCNSGHEYENLGAEHALKSGLPPPGSTALWIHLGANVAARDWHELTGDLLPLPSADPQRYLVATPGLLERSSQAFAGQTGLEAAYASTGFTAGELTNILAAGYPEVLGIFGSHRFHHAREDDEHCLDPAATRRVISSLKRILGEI